MTTLQIRIDTKTKKSAQKILQELGLDMTTAITVYLKRIVTKKGIPFELITENGLTLEQEVAILKASEEAERGINVVRTTTWEETLAHLNQLKKHRKRTK